MEKFKWVKIEELRVELDSYQGPPTFSANYCGASTKFLVAFSLRAFAMEELNDTFI
jgi:hypothetical protein